MPYRIKININNVADFIFAFLLIYFTRSMWPSIPTLSSLDILMKLLFLGVLSIKIFSTHLNRQKVNYFFVLGATLSYLLLFVVFNPTNIETYIKAVLLAIGTIAYQVCESEKHSALKYYVQIMYIISIISLIFWLFGSILGIIHPNGYVYSMWTGSDRSILVPTYYYIHFEPQYVDFLFFTRILRNSSLFVEAPMYTFHLCVAILFELFVLKDTNIKKYIAFIIAIVTTFSITGYITVVVAFSLKYIITGEKKKISQIIKVLLIPWIIVVLSVAIERLITTKLGTISGSTRLDDFYAGYRAWMNNPLFGNGYNNIKAIQQYMSRFRLNNTGFSNSPMLILAYGGLYLAIPYIVSIYCCIKKSLGHKERLCFVFLFLFILTVTIVPFQPLAMYILSWLITQGDNVEQDSPIMRKRY